MGEAIKKIEKQNITPQQDKSQIKVTSIFKDKGKSFQQVMEDIIKNASSK